jgi:prolyl oligopeptidase
MFMKKSILMALTGLFMAGNAFSQEKLEYPKTQKTDVTDTYFGKTVPDPYRWLEDDNSEQTAKWVQSQNKVTQEYLSKIPYRQQIKERLTKLWNYPRIGVPSLEGNHYFFFKNDGTQNQSVLYIQNSLDDEPRVFLDPNKLSTDGTVALGEYNVSKDGKYFAYAVSKAGSDWSEIYVKETESGVQLNDKIEWVKFSGISWKDDGFYYSRYDEPVGGGKLTSKNEYHKVYYHKLGEPQSNDKLIYKNDNYPLRNYYVFTTEDEKFLILSESESTSGNSLYIKDLSSPSSEFVLIAQGFDNEYGVIHNVGKNFFIMTNYNAPRNCVVEVDLAQPDKKNWKVIIPEKEEVLQSVYVSGGKFIAQYMKDATSKAIVLEHTGKVLYDMQLPGIGTLAGFSSKDKETQAFFSFTSFTSPSTIYKYDVNSNKSEVLYESQLNFDNTQYESKQVFYTSKDGTKVPMFIVHKKNIKLDGSNPVYLYGYGGFNVSMTPSFSVSRLVFLENGGVFAMANLRGGGEYGEKWHKAGTKLQKQNVFDDFIAAAEYLIDQKYTSPKKIAIAGGSNGGLLVGACMTQRPDLFGVALPAVGVMDMLRFHKFTIGWAWTTDYGSSENEEEFNYLLGYSPLHNLRKETCYPPTLITTADHDDRVVPAHSFKFAATLQEVQSCDNPTLIRIETNAGHGAGKPLSKMIEETADVWSFTMYNLEMIPAL